MLLFVVIAITMTFSTVIILSILRNFLRGRKENHQKPTETTFEIKKPWKEEPYKKGSFIVIGIGLGVVLGIGFDNLVLGIALGAALGVALDAQQAKKSSKET